MLLSRAPAAAIAASILLSPCQLLTLSLLPAFSYRCCHQAAAASIETNIPNFTIKAAAIPAVAGSCCCFTQNLLPLLLPQATGGASAQHPAVTVPAADIRVFPSRCCYCCCRQPAAVISADVPGAATTAAMITGKCHLCCPTLLCLCRPATATAAAADQVVTLSCSPPVLLLTVIAVAADTQLSSHWWLQLPQLRYGGTSCAWCRVQVGRLPAPLMLLPLAAVAS